MKIDPELVEIARCALEDGGWVGAQSEAASNAVLSAVLPVLARRMMENKSWVSAAELQKILDDAPAYREDSPLSIHERYHVGVIQAMLAAFFKERFDLDVTPSAHGASAAAAD